MRPRMSNVGTISLKPFTYIHIHTYTYIRLRFNGCGPSRIPVVADGWQWGTTGADCGVGRGVVQGCTRLHDSSVNYLKNGGGAYCHKSHGSCQNHNNQHS